MGPRELKRSVKQEGYFFSEPFSARGFVRQGGNDDSEFARKENRGASWAGT